MAVNEAKDRVFQLENAIQKLDSVKKHLNRNASDIKAEIHTNVSRNLECLRGREVSLLSQVDRVLGMKEESLQQQQARLNQALGVIQTGLSMVQEDTASEKQLAETLKKLKRVELSPEETPYISFRADHVGIRESILNYGRVDANGLPLITAFDDPGNPSASLPRHVEEYEDVDHHVFYKTVEEVKRSQNAGSCITVSIPKLSNRVEDWLQKKLPTPTYKSETETVARPLPAIRPSTLTKTGDSPPVGLSRSSTPGSTCSLNNWLSIIKQHADLEEEHDFEIIDNSCPPPRVMSDSVIYVGPKKENVKMIDKGLKAWLDPKSLMNEQFTSDFFKHIPTDAKVWLQQFHTQVTSLGDLQHHDMFAHISKDTSTWLRSRASGKQLTEEVKGGPDFFSHIRKDKEFWLLKKTSVKPNEKVPVSAAKFCVQDWLKKEENKLPLPSQSLPRLLEKLSTEDEPNINIPNCVAPATKEEVAAPVPAHFPDTSPPVLSVFQPVSLPLNDWLIPKKPTEGVTISKKTLPEKPFPDFFRHILETDNSVWLAKPTIVGIPDETPRVDKIWLQKSKGTTTHAPLPVGSDLCLLDWLMVPSEQPEVEKEKEESEGWSVCSDQSINSEQYAKDVAIATDYMHKWLL
ncbi:unnamed protein product [Lymnaea stagnalis]|uniref:Nuclear receptor coactivator 4 N-terminal domain-containing protein n=1 Tax=Lymnaea stagnalis TaxID=6523 RepID=A0AAV2H558_LYMST